MFSLKLTFNSRVVRFRQIYLRKMEEIDRVLQDFSSKLTTESDTSFRLLQYKNGDRPILHQGERRKIYLERQKSLRDESVDKKRGILEAVVASEENEDDSNIYKPSADVAGFTRKTNAFSDTLMLSEWMIEVPEDLEENWLVLACPKGVRVLLIASAGHTKTYNKAGRLHKSWQSELPGGNLSDGSLKKRSVLDCVWSESNQSVYVLDVLMWGNHSVTDCDMDFRDNWIRSKFSEDPSYGTISDTNHYPLNLVPKFNCDKPMLNEFMSIWPPFLDDTPPIDGFLFYHKKAHYVAGTSPLFVWLYPYMINELLGEDVTVHDNYNAMKPKSYVDQKTFIRAFEEKSAMKNARKGKFGSRAYSAMFSKPFFPRCENVANQDVVVFGGEEGPLQTVFDKSPSNNTKKNKNRRRRKNRNNSMETDANSSPDKSMTIDDQREVNKSIEEDSAVSSMEDSILEGASTGHDDSGFKAMD